MPSSPPAAHRRRRIARADRRLNDAQDEKTQVQKTFKQFARTFTHRRSQLRSIFHKFDRTESRIMDEQTFRNALSLAKCGPRPPGRRWRGASRRWARLTDVAYPPHRYAQ